MGPRSFVGELGLLNGQGAFLSARVTEPGRVLRVTRADLRKLMAEDDELCDIVLHALWARRESLRRGPAALTLKFVGPTLVARLPRAAALRRAARPRPHGRRARRRASSARSTGHDFTVDDLPVAFIQGEPILRATPGIVAERLGLSYQADADEIVDLVVVGGGPAGLAAAIYGASEGLSTVLLDAVAPGGQAAATSRIENFLGFPFGVSGGDLIGQASLQALKFGVRVYAPCEAVKLEPAGRPAGCDADRRPRHPCAHRDRHLGRRLPPLDLDRWADFERRRHLLRRDAARAAAGDGLARRRGRRRELRRPGVAVPRRQRLPRAPGRAGHATSARGCRRTSSTGSSRTRASRCTPRSQVVGLDGGGRRSSASASTRVGDVDARGLFCFIGADPATSWLAGARPRRGRLPAHRHRHRRRSRSAQWQTLGREPLPFETSIPAGVRRRRRAARIDEARRRRRRRGIERRRVGAPRARRLTEARADFRPAPTEENDPCPTTST